jgi:hypothetical protein
MTAKSIVDIMATCQQVTLDYPLHVQASLQEALLLSSL